MKRRPVVLFGVLLLALGCGEGTGGGVISDGGDGDGSVSESSAGADEGKPEPGTTAMPPGTDDDGTSGSTGTSGSGSGSESGTGETTGGSESVCDPQPEGAPFWLAVDWSEERPFIDDTIELDVACTVATLGVASGILSMVLDCEDAIHTLDVAELGAIDLALGDAVALRVHDSQPWWRQTHVLLLREGAVIVAGMRSESLPWGDGGADDPAGTFFEPLGIEVEQDVCDAEPLPEEDPRGCNFLCAPACTQDERQALRFTSAEQEQVVYDGNLGSVDGLALAVRTARTHVQVLCTDTPGAWYEFLAVRTR